MFTLSFSLVSLIITASGTVYLGSILSTGGQASLLHRIVDEEEQEALTCSQAIAMPIYASCCLIVLFFYFTYVQYILLFLIISSAAISTYNLSVIALAYLQAKWCSCGYGEAYRLWCIPFLSVLTTGLVLLDYFLNDNYLCNDLLGVSLAIMFISTLRFPSIKLATITLLLLVAYDIFWVFFSEYFFSQNVMVEVATKSPSNPLQALGESLDVPVLKAAARSLQLPIKLLVPYEDRFVMLGLGDIALPGAFVALSLKCDDYLDRLFLRAKLDNQPHPQMTTERRDDEQLALLETGNSSILHGGSNESLVGGETPNSKKSRLFIWTWFGYVFGLILALSMSFITRHPQPALIYLVPTTVGMCLGRGWFCGQLTLIWSGPFPV
eukprot:gene4534-4973_t